MFNVLWGTTRPAQIVKSADHVFQLIEKIEAEAHATNTPISIDVSINKDTTFGITVGSDLSHTQFYDASRRPPIATSLDIVDSDELIEVDFMGELSQMERRYWIPIELAKRALRYYLETGQRFEEIKWTN
jgi:hypothetical protein